MKTKLLLVLIILNVSIGLKFTFGQLINININTVNTHVAHLCVNDSLYIRSTFGDDVLINSNFDSLNLGTGWTTGVSVPLFINPCPPINLPASGAYCWFGGSAFPREIATIAYNISGYESSSVCFIEWDMKYGANENLTNCEAPDLPSEGVHLQYSTSVTTPYTWNQIAGEVAPIGTFGTTGYVNGSGGFWTPVANNSATGPYYSWNHYKTNIPALAYSPNTRFRFFQDLVSGNDFDHWGVDNVKILCPSNPYIEWTCLEWPGWNSQSANIPPVKMTQIGVYHFALFYNNLANGIILQDTITIYVDTLAVNGTISGPATICVGQNNVVYTVDPATAGTLYLWTLPNGCTGSTVSNHINVTVGNQAQSGIISVFGKNACGTGDTSVFPVIIKQLPSTPGSISGITTVCQDQHNITYSIQTVSGADSYNWTLPAGAYGISTTNSIKSSFPANAQSGIIKVKAHNTCGYGNPSMLPVIVNNCIGSDVFTNDDVRIFPNPISYSTSISYNLKINQLLNISIYDITGRKVKEILNTNQQAGIHHLNYDASALSTGTYFLQLKGDDVLNTVKFSVIH